jgi:thiamine biosynthesis lipoprotein
VLRLNLNFKARAEALAPALLACACASPGPESAVGGHEALGVDGPHAIERELAAMGTWFSIRVEAPDRPAALAASESAFRAVRAVEQRLSTWSEDSELGRLNAAPPGTPVRLSPESLAELGRAFELAARTGEAFSPAAGPLVDAYDLRGAGRWPGPGELELALERSRSELWRTTDLAAVRLDAGARIEEGAWAKGAGLDGALAALAQTGASAARLDLGGELARFGRERERGIEVADPRDRARIALRLSCALPHAATSANTERSLAVDGRALPHLLDPRSGEPAPSAGSVTVLCARGLDADALSTALFVLGPDAGLAFAEAAPETEAVFLIPDSHGLLVRATSGLSPRLAGLVPDLRIAP